MLCKHIALLTGL